MSDINEALLERTGSNEAADSRFSFYRELRQPLTLEEELLHAAGYVGTLPEVKHKAGLAKQALAAYSDSRWRLYDEASAALVNGKINDGQRKLLSEDIEVMADAVRYDDRAVLVRKAGERATAYLLSNIKGLENLGKHTYWPERDQGTGKVRLFGSDDNAEPIVFSAGVSLQGDIVPELGARVATVEDYGQIILDVIKQLPTQTSQT